MAEALAADDNAKKAKVAEEKALAEKQLKERNVAESWAKGLKAGQRGEGAAGHEGGGSNSKKGGSGKKKKKKVVDPDEREERRRRAAAEEAQRRAPFIFKEMVEIDTLLEKDDYWDGAEWDTEALDEDYQLGRWVSGWGVHRTSWRSPSVFQCPQPV